jgi:preprotein translocase subunit SecA
MIGYIIKKIIGSRNDREVKRLRPMVAKINELETALQSQSDDVRARKPPNGRPVAPQSRTTTSFAKPLMRSFPKLLRW